MNSITVRDPWNIVLLGITGDAAQRMYAGGLFKAYSQALIDPDTFIIGVAPEFWKKKWDEKEVKSHIRYGVENFGGGIKAEQEYQTFQSRLKWFPGNVCDSSFYKDFKPYLADLATQNGSENQTLWILSLPPQLLIKVIENLLANDLVNEGTRIFIDKPFGANYADSEALKKAIKRPILVAA